MRAYVGRKSRKNLDGSIVLLSYYPFFVHGRISSDESHVNQFRLYFIPVQVEVVKLIFLVEKESSINAFIT